MSLPYGAEDDMPYDGGKLPYSRKKPRKDEGGAVQGQDYLKPILDLAAAVGTKGVLSAMQTPQRIADTVSSGVNAARLPGDVVTGRIDPMSDEGVRRAVNLANLATTGALGGEAPVGALGAGMRREGRFGALMSPVDELYHGSSVAGLSHLKPSERGPLGPGVYTSTSPAVAGRYGDTVYNVPHEGLDIFRGEGSRTDAQYLGFKDDRQRLIDALPDARKAELQPMIEKMWQSDGYPLYQRLRIALGSDQAAQDVFRSAGFHGLSGQVDGPETVIFGNGVGLNNPEKKGIIAYHGSPHSFDRFDLSKIGTGEGAQAYGHGLYFADNEGVARSYRDANQTFKTFLNGEPIEPSHPQFQTVMSIGANGYDKALKQAEEFAAAGFVKPEEVEAIRALKGAKVEQKPGGSMYQVRINADPEHFLDFDSPYTKQSPYVQQALSKMVENTTGKPRDLPNLAFSESGEGLSAWLHGWHDHDSAKLSNSFLEHGIPGNKYLDQGSRRVSADGPNGTRNYVVFDDNLVDILKKYASGGDVSAPITGQHTITLDDLIGRATSPASTPGAYTDAGGQSIAAPYVTGMMGGYPVAPVTPAATPQRSSTQDYGGWHRRGYAEGGETDPVGKVLDMLAAGENEARYAQFGRNVPNEITRLVPELYPWAPQSAPQGLHPALRLYPENEQIVFPYQ